MHGEKNPPSEHIAITFLSHFRDKFRDIALPAPFEDAPMAIDPVPPIFPAATPTPASDVPQPQPGPTPSLGHDTVTRSDPSSHPTFYDLPTLLRQGWNFAVGDDLGAATDTNRSPLDRTAHAGMLLITVADPTSLGLRMVEKAAVKGGTRYVLSATEHGIAKAAAEHGPAKLASTELRTARLAIEAGAGPKPHELKLAAELVARGDHVTILRPSGVGKTPDFVINGKLTELKTMSNVKAADAGTAVTATIKKATKQADRVLIDARGQHGLTKVNAENAVRQAVRSLSKPQIKEVRFIGREGNRTYEFTVKK